jgi:hypothetical protein
VPVIPENIPEELKQYIIMLEEKSNKLQEENNINRNKIEYLENIILDFI